MLVSNIEKMSVQEEDQQNESITPSTTMPKKRKFDSSEPYALNVPNHESEKQKCNNNHVFVVTLLTDVNNDYKKRSGPSSEILMVCRTKESAKKIICEKKRQLLFEALNLEDEWTMEDQKENDDAIEEEKGKNPKDENFDKFKRRLNFWKISSQQKAEFSVNWLNDHKQFDKAFDLFNHHDFEYVSEMYAFNTDKCEIVD